MSTLNRKSVRKGQRDRPSASTIRDGREGFTLTEAVIAGVLAVMLVLGIYQSISTAQYAARNLADHVAAYGICRERYERERAKGVAGANNRYNAIQPYTETIHNFTHNFGGSGARDATISVAVTNITDNEEYAFVQDTTKRPQRKHLAITVAWTDYKGVLKSETLLGDVHNPDLPQEIADFKGTICLTPHNSSDTNYFVQITGHGTSVGPAAKTCSGKASKVVFRVNGDGMQGVRYAPYKLITYKGKQFKMRNDKHWVITAPEISYRMYNESSRWYLEINNTTRANAYVTSE